MFEFLRKRDKRQREEAQAARRRKQHRMARLKTAFMAAAPGGDHFRRQTWAELVKGMAGLTNEEAEQYAYDAARRIGKPRRGRPPSNNWPGFNAPGGAISQLATLVAQM